MIDSEKIKELFPDYLDRCNREYYIIDKEHFVFSKKDALELVSDLIDSDYPELINIECFEAEDRWDHSHVLNKVSDDSPVKSELGSLLELLSGTDPVIAYYFYDESLDGGAVEEGNFYAFESQDHLDLFKRYMGHTSHNVVIQIQ